MNMHSVVYGCLALVTSCALSTNTENNPDKLTRCEENQGQWTRTLQSGVEGSGLDTVLNKKTGILHACYVNGGLTCRAQDDKGATGPLELVEDPADLAAAIQGRRRCLSLPRP